MNKLIKSFRNSTTGKDAWSFIIEARNAQLTKTHISRLRNSIRDLITDPKCFANLLNYRFSQLGDYCGKKNTRIKTEQ